MQTFKEPEDNINKLFQYTILGKGKNVTSIFPYLYSIFIEKSHYRRKYL